MSVNFIKGNFAIKAVGQDQGLSVSRNEVDDEVMTLQAQAMQRGEKFKEAEVRPRVEAQLEKGRVLSWLQSHATVTFVDAKDFDASEVLGQTPEELAATMRSEAPAEASAATDVAKASTATEPAADAKAAAATAQDSPGPASPDGFDWGGTF